MKVLYIRTGWMNSYNGLLNDRLRNGGSYNKNNIGHEIYNFSEYNGKYYGYVQPLRNTINIDRISSNNGKYVDNVLVICIATSEDHGQVIIGWYENARVYRNYQKVPSNVLDKRDCKFDDYNIYSEKATLILPIKNRIFEIKKEDGIGQSNVWFGNENTNEKVIKYIKDYDLSVKHEFNRIEQGLELLKGYDKEIITKARINQGIFRNIMLEKYKHCCLCEIDIPDLLVASHIKPWNKSNSIEKLSEYNGLLFCSMHDKLFDKGYISFNNDGTLLISNKLTTVNQKFCNIDQYKKINISTDNIPFIEFHRKNIFKS